MMKRTVLVVDDEADIRELLGFTLGREGYLVTQADSGEAALRSIGNAPPDLVLLDLMLPGLDA
jgi:DNA-binding response OmpR family regulator